MQYDYKKYVELLKYADLLRKQNKFLEDENESKYLELTKYSLQINEHLHWCQKNSYVQLIEDFLNFKIDGKTFDKQFCTMVHEIEKNYRLLIQNYDELKNIKPNPIAFDFSKWISEIYLCCDEFYPNFDPADPPDFPHAKNEKDLRSAVSEILPQIQKY